MDENQIVQDPGRGAVEGGLGEVEIRKACGLGRRAFELAGELVDLAMVGTHDHRPGVAVAFQQFGAPVTADVVEAPQLAVASAHNRQGMDARLYCLIFAGFLEVMNSADKAPGPAEQLVAFPFEPVLVDVGLVGQALTGCVDRIEARGHDRSFRVWLDKWSFMINNQY
tara:strand:- start:195 stop:698 length:504 start_codon:yes stop_codon:yes gene_type:complete